MLDTLWVGKMYEDMHPSSYNTEYAHCPKSPLCCTDSCLSLHSQHGKSENECESHSVLCDSLQSHGLYSQWNSPGQNTRVRNRFLLQGIFSTQGSDPGLLHCRQILYQLNHKGSPRILECVAYPFSRGSTWPRKRTRVSCTAGGFFTIWAMLLLLLLLSRFSCVRLCATP